MNQSGRVIKKIDQYDKERKQELEKFKKQDQKVGQISKQNSNYMKRRIEKMYSFPAKLSLAQMHKRANTIGYRCKQIEQGDIPYCCCCQLPVHLQDIEMCHSSTTPQGSCCQKASGEIFRLNPGIAMFFTFIKMAIFYLLLRFLISDGYNLITNTFYGHYCGDHSEECSNLSSRLSTYNKKTPEDQKLLHLDSWLNLASVLGSILFFIIYRWYQIFVYYSANKNNHTQDDYTVLVENIPIFLAETDNQKSYHSLLKETIEDYLHIWLERVKEEPENGFQETVSRFKLMLQIDKEGKTKIQSISLCYDLSEIERIDNLRQNLMENFNIKMDGRTQLESQNEETTIQIIKQLSKVDFVNELYFSLCQKFALDHQLSFNLPRFVGKAFVSFRYQFFRDCLLYGSKKEQPIKIGQNVLKFSKAAPPSDVNWFNMKVSNEKRYLSTFFSYIIMGMLLFFSFLLLFALQIYQNYAAPTASNSKAEPTLKQEIYSSFLEYIMIGLTALINTGLTWAMERLTTSEKHISKTNHFTSLIIKNVIAQFLNTAIIYYIILLMHPQIQPLSGNGIVVKIMSIVTLNGLLQVIYNAKIIETIYQKCIKHKKEYVQPEIFMFQIQLNQKLQLPEFDFSDRYAYYISQVFVISFYSMIAPSCSIILCITFIIQYWIDKYNLFKKFSCPIDFNFQLSRLTITIFEISMTIFAIGNYIFSQRVTINKDQFYEYLDLMTLGIAVAYSLFIIFMPKSWEHFLFYPSFLQYNSYINCLYLDSFKHFYWLLNPATSFAQQRDVNDPKVIMNNFRLKKVAEQENSDQAQQEQQEKTQRRFNHIFHANMIKNLMKSQNK